MANGKYLDEYGHNPFESSTGYGSALADDQEKNVFAPANRQRDAFANILNNGFKTDLTSPWASLYTSHQFGSQPVSPSTNKAGKGQNKNDLFSLLKVSKDPTGAYDKANTDYLGQINSTHPDYTNVRSQIQNFLSDNTNNFDSDQSQVRSDTDSLINKYQSQIPALDNETEQQAGQLDRYFLNDTDPNSIRSKLAGETGTQNAAELQAAKRAQQQAFLRSRLSGVGTGSSYANAQSAGVQSKIAETNAIRASERARGDTAAVLAAQQHLAGRPQELRTNNILRSNIPIEARNALIDRSAAQVGARLHNAGSALAIDQQSDPLAVTGRKLGLNREALQQYLQGSFFGVQKQGEDHPFAVAGYNPRYQNYSGVPNIPPREYGGGGGGYSTGNNDFWEQPNQSNSGRNPIAEEYRNIMGFYPEENHDRNPELIDELNMKYGAYGRSSPHPAWSAPEYGQPSGQINDNAIYPGYPSYTEEGY